jgi:hypothetical protein
MIGRYHKEQGMTHWDSALDPAPWSRETLSRREMVDPSIFARCGSACGDYMNPAICNGFDVSLSCVQKAMHKQELGRERVTEVLF